jgi:hypothetical protein
MRGVVGQGRGLIGSAWGPAAINVNREPKIMVSYASFAAPRQPGRVVLPGAGPQGLDPGGAA